jgi:hypothetical protein
MVRVQNVWDAAALDYSGWLTCIPLLPLKERLRRPDR